MIKKNILILLMGLFVLVSCEEEIYENTNISMSVEQYAPIQENGVMMLSGKVTLPQEFNRETAKVGFYVREFTKDMNNSLEWLFDEYVAIKAYRALMNGGQSGSYYDEQILWVDGMNSDGTFQTSFHPEMKQYVCFAFAINALQWEISECQVLSSKPFFFTGEGTAQLKLVDVLAHRFELAFSGESGLEVGLCWSATNAQPNVDDACIYGYYGNGNSTNSVTFDWLNFGDHDVVYVRGYVQKRIENSNSSGGASYKMIYSNVIEFRPKEYVVTINSKSDLQNLINSMYAKYDD